MRAVFGKTLATVLVIGVALVAPASPAMAATGMFISYHDGRCLDADKPTTTSQAHNGTKVQVWQCWGGNNQEWTWYTDGTIRPTWNTSYCLDEDIAGGTHNGTKVQLWECNGWDNQKWDFHSASDYAIVSRHDRRCLDEDIYVGTQNGTKAQVWDCNDQDNQKWHR
jgi:hypothetical protein